MKINTLAVFCGSKTGDDPLYAAHAAETGRLLARHNIMLVYGGGGKGIMKSIADAVIQNSGKVTGVIPRKLIEWEHQHDGITELIIVEDMHIRKRTIYERCDAAMILPGGFGTLDELFEMLTWNQLAIHDKPIFILNSGGFYDHLIGHIHRLEKSGFLYEPVEQSIYFLNEPEELLAYIR